MLYWLNEKNLQSGHKKSLQVKLILTAGPSQGFPNPSGGGLVQLRVALYTPPPHETLQESAGNDHAVQPPSAK